LGLELAKIVSFNFYKYSVPLQGEFRISFSSTSVSEGIIVEAVDEEGRRGYGEASPSSKIVGTTPESSFEVMKKLAMQILELDLTPWQAHKLISSAVIHNGDAKAAIEGAILDIHCRALGLPVYKCLGGCRKEFVTDITVGIKSIEETVKDIERYLAEGFSFIKVKVGESPEKDLEKIRAIREKLGYAFALRVDANQGWTFKQAVKAAKGLEKYEVELIEQPLKYWDFESLKLLRKLTSIPIAVDESVHTTIDAARALRYEVADVINIKIMKAGGILEGFKIAAMSEAFGVKNMIGCMLETRLGITMSAHLVGLTDNIVYVDLDSDLSLVGDPTSGGVEHLGGGRRVIPDKPGFGVEVDKSKLVFLGTVKSKEGSHAF